MPFPDQKNPRPAAVFAFATSNKGASIGSINVQVQLDKLTFIGSRDKINGTIILKFNPTKQARTNGNNASTGISTGGQEIFGPLTLKVVLQGHARLKVQENRTSHAYILFFETRQLFRRSVLVFDGPLRARANEPKIYPFQISFPEETDRRRGICSTLPPTFYTRFHTEASRQAGYHSGVAWLDYSLHVQAAMPGIDIEITSPPEVALRFEQANPRLYPDLPSRTLEQRHTVQSYDLLPEDERPSGIFDRTRAVFRSVQKPSYVFDAICSSLPQALHLDSTLTFSVRVRSDSEATTATIIPAITLSGGEVEILSRTQMYATSEKGEDSPKLDHLNVVATLPLLRQEPDGPFAKASDYTKTLSTGPVPLNLPTSFRIIKLERSYRLRVVLRFLVAGQVVLMKKDAPLTLHPPLEDGASGSVALAGPSGSSAGGSGGARRRLSLPPPEPEQLPAYEEALKSEAVI